MAKTVVFDTLGGPENLKLQDLPTRAPEQGEAKLRVEAVGLNRAELMYLGGRYFEQPQLPSRIGYELIGIVEAVGPGVDPSWIGKRVGTIPGYSMNKNGVLGEEAVVPADRLVEHPDKLSPTEGAAVWMQYLTAYPALIMHGKVAEGDFVVITAASSSVGLAAIQIAKAQGATAIATTRHSDKREALLAEGADHVIATEEEDLPARIKEITGGKLARVIFDPVAGSMISKLADSLSQGGTLFVYGDLSGEPIQVSPMQLIGKTASLRGTTIMEVFANKAELPTAVQYVRDRLTDGRFHPKIAKTFPLDQSVAAYQYLASNQQVGKVVITVP